MRYDFLLFDADNTLFDFTASEKVAFHETFACRGIKTNKEMLETYSDYNRQCWQAHENGELSRAELVVKRFDLFLRHYDLEGDPSEINNEYIEHLSGSAILLPGALEMIEHLHEKAGVYIITNGLAKVQMGRFAKTELTNHIDKIFISEQIGSQKPDRRFFECVASQIEGFSEKRAVVIGDSLTGDIKGANNFGLDCVWFNPQGKKAPPELTITKIAASFAEIELFLKGMIE